VSILVFCTGPAYIGTSFSVVRAGVKGMRRSFRRPAPPKAGVKGVRGVLGVEMYRPLHFGHRNGSSLDEEETDRKPFDFPARRGWYR
jgi:hypothetical protein